MSDWYGVTVPPMGDTAGLRRGLEAHLGLLEGVLPHARKMEEASADPRYLLEPTTKRDATTLVERLRERGVLATLVKIEVDNPGQAPGARRAWGIGVTGFVMGAAIEGAIAYGLGVGEPGVGFTQSLAFFWCLLSVALLIGFLNMMTEERRDGHDLNWHLWGHAAEEWRQRTSNVEDQLARERGRAIYSLLHIEMLRQIRSNFTTLLAALDELDRRSGEGPGREHPDSIANTLLYLDAVLEDQAAKKAAEVT